MVEIILDGKTVDVREGSMIMDAANKTGTYIPHFCYHKKLSIAANCRMCLVDVEKAPKPMPACATPVTNGMVVHTKSDKAAKAQQGVMEFLLINHPLDCPICDQGGECQLQDLAVGYGSSSSRYKEEKRVVLHKDVGPLVSMEEMTRCIHCTRCVRFGVEIAGQMELGMVGRGEHSEITTFLGKTIDSELSGNMIDLCPVGALTSKPFRYSARTWELSRRKSVSPHDSLGANLVVQVKANTVMRVLPYENEDVNECWLSDKDRFAYAGLNTAERLTKPMLKQGGEWFEVEWQDALEYVAKGLQQIRADHGEAAIGALATPHSTLEELHLLQKLVRGLGSDNIDTRLRQSDFPAMAAAPWLGMKIAEVSTLDRLLVIGSFLRKDHALLSARIRSATKHGAKLSVLHAADDDLLMPVANKIIIAPSGWVNALAQIAAAIAAQQGSTAPLAIAGEPSAQAKSIATSLLSGEQKAVFLGNAAVQHPAYGRLFSLAQWISNATGARLGVLTEAANTVGAHLAKAMPLTGGRSAAAMLGDAPCKAVLLFNVEAELDAANPAAARAALAQGAMVVAFSAYKHAALEYADVLLPIAPFSETGGSFVNCEGRLQSFNGATRPLGDTRPGWKVLRVLGNVLDLPGFAFDTVESVRAEVAAGATDLSERCGNRVELQSGAVNNLMPVEGALERVTDVPIHFADAIARRSPPLQQTADARAPLVRLNARSLARHGLSDGDLVRVTQGSVAVVLPCVLDSTLADGCARIATAHELTSGLGPMYGPVTVQQFQKGAATVASGAGQS
jgi:NADH-quinone oxidoreductase subunit G